jgi:hypothetical protein
MPRMSEATQRQLSYTYAVATRDGDTVQFHARYRPSPEAHTLAATIPGAIVIWEFDLYHRTDTQAWDVTRAPYIALAARRARD